MAQDLVHVQVGSLAVPEYIHDFPETAKRSVKGSVHVRQGTLFLTSDEYEHITKKYAHLARAFTVVAGPVDPQSSEASSGDQATSVESSPVDAAIVDAPMSSKDDFQASTQPISTEQTVMNQLKAKKFR